MSTRTFTFRDAGLHSRPLRLYNRLAAPLAARGVKWPSLAPGDLRAAAVKETGLHDFGDDTISEPLEILTNSAENDVNLTGFGRIVFRGLLVSSLSERLRFRSNFASARKMLRVRRNLRRKTS